MEILSIFTNDELKILKKGLEENDSRLISGLTCIEKDGKIEAACFLTYPLFKSKECTYDDLINEFTQKYRHGYKYGINHLIDFIDSNNKNIWNDKLLKVIKEEIEDRKC